MPQQLTVVKSEPLRVVASSQGKPPTPASSQPAPQQPDGGTNGFLREFWKQVNPLELARGLSETVRHPVQTAKMIGAAQGSLFDKAKASADSGDYVTATRHFLNYLLPIVGPGVDAAADMMQEGRIAEGLGATSGIGVSLAAGPAIKNAGAIRVPAVGRNPVAAEREAVALGLREGVPVDAGTASGNRFVRGVQRVADESMAGSIVSGRANQRQAVAMRETGERLAGRVHPTAATAEQAGMGVRQAVEADITRLAREADDAYGRLRQFEQNATPTAVTSTVQGRVAGGGSIPIQQTTPIRLAVDIAATKKAMQSAYETLRKENELVPFVSGSGKGKALVALQKLMDAPDHAPLSIADGALSELKAMARGAEMPALRTEGQGIAAQAVKNLELAVRDTATKAGPDVFKALMEGRNATKAKYIAADILDELAEEPVRTTSRLTAQGDSSISLLRRVLNVAPKERGVIARSVLDGLIEKATAEGGFGRGAGIFADWNRLGAETKRVLYGAQAKDLDAFFLLAKKLSESPNPSGTALTLAKTGEIGLLASNPMLGGIVSISAPSFSALARNPRFVRLLTRGLSIPVSNKAASTALVAELNALARESGVSLNALPAAAEGERQER